MQDVFAQLAAVSAVLGGFVVTFLAVLTSIRPKTRRVGFALAIAVAAAGLLILAALGWALFAAQAARIGDSSGTELAMLEQRWSLALPLLGRISAFFALGVLLLVCLLGTSGWLHSRRVGIITLLMAVFFAVNAITIIRPFVT